MRLAVMLMVSHGAAAFGLGPCTMAVPFCSAWTSGFCVYASRTDLYLCPVCSTDGLLHCKQL